jgi:hypothetical protein
MALHKDVRDGIVKENIRPDGRKAKTKSVSFPAKLDFCRELMAPAYLPAV